MQARALRELGIETELLDAAPALRNPLFRIPHEPGSAYVFHSGGPQTASLIGSVLPHAAEAYRIAYWAWELPDPPDGWANCDRNVAEIWTPSTFSQRSLAGIMHRPISVVPHHLPSSPARERREGEPFRVLTMADSRSSLSRKNPEGAVKAFQKAFGTSLSARLTLKLSGREEEIAAFEASLGGHAPQREYRDRQGPPGRRRARRAVPERRRAAVPAPRRRIRPADAGGHGARRSGGRHRLVRQPRIQDSANSLLVPYTLVAVQDPAAIYSGSTWAEPDLDAAAQDLRRLADSPSLYRHFAAAAHRSVAETAPNFPFVLSRPIHREAVPALP